MPALWALSDVSMVLLSKSELFKPVIPSKIFESMAMEKPILLGVDGEVRRIVESGGEGVFFESEDDTALASAILELRDDPRRVSELGAAGRQLAVSQFDRRQLTARYLDLLDEVTVNRLNGNFSRLK